MRTRPLLQLNPGFFELTPMKGVIRVLKPKDSTTRAQGLLFKCPRCLGDKEKSHFLIFIFDFEGIDPTLRPAGRYSPTMRRESAESDVYVPVHFSRMTLQNLNAQDEWHVNDISYSDVPCGWKGTLREGVVSWMPAPHEKGLSWWR